MDATNQSMINDDKYENIKDLLQKQFGHNNLESQQYEIINKIISGEDVCTILPHGNGKNLIIQIISMYINKPVIIISPLIQLINYRQIIFDKLGINTG